jgi:hypothetical protein
MTDPKRDYHRTHLTNGKMTETTDELALVQRVSGLLHAAHRDHLRIQFKEAVFGDLDVKGRAFSVIASERVFMKPDREWRRTILWY